MIRLRPPTALLALLLAGVTAVALGACGRGPSDSPAEAEANPCLQPLPWRIGTVDPRFGLTPDQLRDAVATAATIWERGTGRRLFAYDSAGMPIHMVYDHRQQQATAHRERRNRFRDMQADIARLRAEQQRRIALLEEQVRDHNTAVERWNQRRGGSDDERRRLERERAAIDELREEGQRAARTLASAVEAYNDSIDAYRPSAPVRVQAGAFEETVITRGGRITRAAPRLSIFQFEDRDELVLVLAHELGHALGLGHVADPAALMFGEYNADASDRDPELSEADIAALIERCGPEAWDATASDRGAIGGS